MEWQETKRIKKSTKNQRKISFRNDFKGSWISLYLDTSALVKLYINEPNREQVMHAVKNAKVVASHKIGFVEVHATFARLQRENRSTLKDLQITKDSFSNDWKDYMQISISDSLLQQAADFTEAFSSRAFDSVHLAAADDLQK